MKLFHTKTLAATAALTLGLTVGVGSAAVAADTVTIGYSGSLSGPVAQLGITAKNGIMLAIDKINANGGLLGKQVKLVVADGELKPSTGATNVRNFILSHDAKAIMGPTASSVAAAEAVTASRYHVPIFFNQSNDISLTGTHFSKYVFQVVPSTYMEPHAIAAYVTQKSKHNDWETYATISPNYSFGHSTVKYFLQAMDQFGADIKVVSQQWPALGASDFTQYISATLAENPDFVFIGQYGGDLITLTKQAAGYGLFNKNQVYAAYWLGTLQALGPKAPAGVISVVRSSPFYLNPSEQMKTFTKKYHDQYGGWPTTWAVMAYSAVEAWADGVKKAGSFDSEKVAEALSGATVDTIRGSFKLRKCDHLAMVPEYVGVLSDTVDEKYGFRTITDVYKAPADKIMMSCEDKKALQQS